MENDSIRPMGLTATKGMGLQAKDYKVGDKMIIVIKSYGDFVHYFEDMYLQSSDRLVEVEVKSVKAIKKQEFIEM